MPECRNAGEYTFNIFETIWSFLNKLHIVSEKHCFWFLESDKNIVFGFWFLESESEFKKTLFLVFGSLL